MKLKDDDVVLICAALEMCAGQWAGLARTGVDDTAARLRKEAERAMAIRRALLSSDVTVRAYRGFGSNVKALSS